MMFKQLDRPDRLGIGNGDPRSAQEKQTTTIARKMRTLRAAISPARKLMHGLARKTPFTTEMGHKNLPRLAGQVDPIAKSSSPPARALRALRSGHRGERAKPPK